MFQANGALEGVQEVQNEMLKIRSNHGGGSFSGTNASNDANDGRAIVTGDSPNRRIMYVWGGVFHNVSQGFKIPTISLQTLITYWFLGSKHPRVPPLRFIKAYNFTNKKHIGVKISQMKKDNEACNKGSRISKFRRFEWNWFC